MVRFMRGPPGSAPRPQLRKLADEELVQLVAASDADAFEVVFERHADAAFALAYRMCGRRSVAEDVAQEAVLALWRSAGRYDRARGSVRTWALGIVHNRAVDALRRSSVHERRRAPRGGAEEALEAPERTDVQAIGNATSAELRGALEQLPLEQRRVIEPAHFAGFTPAVVASLLATTQR